MITKTVNIVRATAAIGVLLSSAYVSADLYVSDVTLSEAEYKQAEEVRKKGNGIVLTGDGADGQYVLSEYEPEQSAILRFGKNVPLMVALDKLVPSESYKVNYDEDLESTVVSWRGGETWLETLAAISEQNPVDIFVNHQERVIGVSLDTNISMHLASEKPKVWRLRTELSLKENFEKWAETAGWSLAWGVEFDFPVDHKATIFGDFSSQSGPVDQALQAYQNAATPLTAHFHKNKVLRITEAGFRQEVSY